MQRQQYFNHASESDVPHYQQPWVLFAMNAFHTEQNKWRQRLCNICQEVWPTTTCLTVPPCDYICSRCKRDKNDIKLYSKEKDMLPGRPPACLVGLSQVEEMLTACAYPIMCVYRKHGGQRGYKDHVLKDIQTFLDHLPCNIEEEQEDLSDQSTYSDSSGDEIDDSRSFLPTPKQSGTENDMIQATIDGIDPLDWPNIDGEPINKFKTSGLATVAFPTGTGDPTCSGRQRYVSFTDAFKHLMRYADAIENSFLLEIRLASQNFLTGH